MTERSKTTIANIALDVLNKARMGDIDAPQGPLEEQLAERFDDWYEIALKLKRWPELRKVADLVATPASGDAAENALQIPNDCLAVWAVKTETSQWRRVRADQQGLGAILTTAQGTVSIEYAARAAPAKLSPELADVAGHLMALRALPRAGLSANRALQVRNEFQQTLLIAARTLTKESGTQKSPEDYAGGSWLDRAFRW